jgi:RimJ/RimL family protein N-acetyltransferase
VIELELFSADHLADMAALTHDPGVHRFTRVPVPVPPGFERTWLDRYEQARINGSGELFSILGAESREFLGLAMAAHINVEERTAELGYVVVPSARGRGVASAALQALTNWALDTLAIQRLELLISVENEPSKRVAARCGYVFEGVLRSVYFKQGRREDTEIWSRLPTDT